jgi:hypothetical protein
VASVDAVILGAVFNILHVAVLEEGTRGVRERKRLVYGALSFSGCVLPTTHKGQLAFVYDGLLDARHLAPRAALRAHSRYFAAGHSKTVWYAF